ncbi:L-threonylcarbamoyladenylate synthase [Nitrospira moscoviensis]|uniref:Threonylcarbamoyl-AMP synthase n=1 Tax=Nitrospira moscoviensis TaxID=42253 RepID=A0A0K2GES6_NITMO|nr:L-threonylcarbamoyladenylate synthase [Nitrospira moscoviensis]ALA59364.1 putative tRNA threonylcarbamoyladenosine biosynthesis protein YwlC [Nitrospira moscoviensis]
MVSTGRIVPAADEESIRLAAEVIRSGGLVAFPTETVYGLGCDALNPEAVARVFEAKQRPSFDPLIVHIERRASLDHLVAAIGFDDHRLMDAFWPGPLTLVLPKRERVPDLVTAGLSTVAIRMPVHPVARALIREAGVPIAAPSANPFGYVSPTTAEHVREMLDDRIDLILDGGPCPIGVESTIISMAGAQPELLRPGSLPLADIEAVVGPVARRGGSDQRPPAPGRLARHYATRTPLTILPAGRARLLGPGERAGLLAMSSPVDLGGYAVVEVLSPSGNLREVARGLFAALRKLDGLGLDHLYAEPCDEQGLGLAIMDRLRRCAAPIQCEGETPLNGKGGCRHGEQTVEAPAPGAGCR